MLFYICKIPKKLCPKWDLEWLCHIQNQKNSLYEFNQKCSSMFMFSIAN